MPGPSSSCVPWSSTPPGAYRPSPISRCGRCCLQATQYLGHPETCSFRGYLPTAHSLACLRFAESVTVSGARLATGRAGSPLAGRVSHPLDDKQGFMKSSHTPFPLDQPCLVALALTLSDPLAIEHVALATTDLFRHPRWNQHHIKPRTVEKLEHRDPVHRSRFHRHLLDPACREPLSQGTQIAGERTELAHRILEPLGVHRHIVMRLADIDPIVA